MDKLQQFFNFSNSDGEVTTYFGGRFTTSQIITFVIVVLAILLVMCFIKGIVKFIVTLVLVALMLVQFGIASPTQLKDIADTISSKGIETYQVLANASENIKLEDSTIKIKIGDDNWIDVTDIKSYVKSDEGVISITVGKETYAITDENVIKLIESFN